MPSFFPEGDVALASDSEIRSLQKIVNLGGTGGGGGGGTQVFKGNYGGGTPTQTPSGSVTAALAYDLDPPNALWTWNGSAWV